MAEKIDPDEIEALQKIMPRLAFKVQALIGEIERLMEVVDIACEWRKEAMVANGDDESYEERTNELDSALDAILKKKEQTNG